MNNNKSMQGEQGDGMMSKGNVKNINGCATINPFEDFKFNEEPKGLYLGTTRGGMSCHFLHEVNKLSNDTIIIDPKSELYKNQFVSGKLGEGRGFSILPPGIGKEQVLNELEFKNYKKENESEIEDIIKNTDNYHGYKYYTICFLNGTADEIFIKN